MKPLLLGAALAALALPLIAQAQQAPNGETLFEQRCAACHAGGGAPPKSELATPTPTNRRSPPS
jgi:cytochrome c5